VAAVDLYEPILTGRLPFSRAADGLRLAIRLTPKASAERISGIAEDAAGTVALKVAVMAPPEAGKANDALLRLLARQFRLRRSDLTLAQGAADRRKLVHVAGDPAALARQLEEALQPWLRRD
jgi:uncharacterized protein